MKQERNKMKFMKSKKFKEIKRQSISYLFIAPAVLVFLIFVFIPMFGSLYWSFTEYNVLQPPQWVGLNNYKTILFDDPRFWKAISNTFIYVLGTVPAGITLALTAAICIDQKIKFKNFFKTSFFLPSVTSVVAISVIWKWLYAGGKYGLLNHFLSKIGLEPVDWLMNVRWTLPSIMMMSIWGGLGYNMILFLAGLQGIPKTYYDAADVDGANVWGKFWHVTIPFLRPTLLFVTIMSFISSFQVFEQVYIMTGGSEGAVGGVLDCALTIVAYLYEMGFDNWKMGYASALAYMIFACLFVITLINLKLTESKVDI
jgi:multiple sugar transport system permease protein